MKILIEESVLRQALGALEEYKDLYLDDYDERKYTAEVVGKKITALKDAINSAEKVEQVKITDTMAYAFHNALTDGSLGEDEVEEIKTGLRAAFADALRTALDNPLYTHHAPAVPEKVEDQLATVTKERDELAAALKSVMDMVASGRPDLDTVIKGRAALAKVGADKTGEV